MAEMCTKNISFYDINEAFLDKLGFYADPETDILSQYGEPLPKEEIQEFFWELGIDNRIHDIEVIGPVFFKALDGTKVYTKYFSGQERIDREWLQSGEASDEVIEGTSGMFDIKQVLAQLRRGE